MSDTGGDDALGPGADAEELAAIARSAHALLDWLDASGALGVPPSTLEAPVRDDVEAAPPPHAGANAATAAPPRVAAAERAAAAATGPPERLDRPHPEAAAKPVARLDRPQPRAAAKPKERPDRAQPRAATKLSGPEQEIARQESLARLAVLEQEVKSCTQCALHRSRTQTVFARGNPQARLVFVGEGPGAEEDRLGLPFVGASGQLLDRMIVAMGYRPEDVYICNIVKCRPPDNRKPESGEMQSCAAFLHEQLERVAPEVIVALGAVAVQGLLEWYDVGGYGPGITRLRGSWKLYRGRVPFMPTFHPAYLLRTPAKKRDVWNDLQAVMRRLEQSRSGVAPAGSDG